MKLKHVLPIIFGIEGLELSLEEVTFFQRYTPLGFILFRRNIFSSEQVRNLVNTIKQYSAYPIVCIDEEGGQVSRLRALGPSYELPEIATYETQENGKERLKAHYQRIGGWLCDLGITVNCAPVLDVCTPQTAGFLRSRCISQNPERVAEWGREVINTLLSNNVLPIMKHMPGHGVASVDSHKTMPYISSDVDLTDHIAPFQKLSDCSWGMSSHLYLESYQECTTHCPKIVEEIIRDRIGFKGFLVSDDLEMGALQGMPLYENCQKSIEAGHDAVLMCKGSLREWALVAQRCPKFSNEGRARLEDSLKSFF